MSDISLVREWLKYSHNDLISATHLFNHLYPKQTEIACYLSQQCAEKVLKGYLFFTDTEPPRTHNLIELCKMCMGHDNTFSEILDACADLTPYGVAVRYPNELAVDEALAKSAIGKAQVIHDFCAGRIPEASSMDRKIIEVNGKKFEVPDLELYCEKCGTMNFFYDDDAPPYNCDNCKKPLVDEEPTETAPLQN